MTDFRRNNFDFLRFAAATAVWYSHCGLFYNLPHTLLYLDMGHIAVGVFFTISGYFITASYDRKKALLPFAWHRALRIFPALIVVVFLSVFLLGPLVTLLSVQDYFSNPQTYSYLKLLLILPFLHNPPDVLPGVFTHFRLPVVNAPLYTLFFEILCYGAVALFGVLQMLRPRIMFALIIGLWLGIFMNPALQPNPIFKPVDNTIEFFIFFAAGSILYLLRDKIPLNFRYFIMAALLLLISVLLHASLLFDLSFAYMVIYVGFLKLPALHNFGKHGDFSYGIYLYAWPIQQALAETLNYRNYPLFVCVSFLLILSCAALSWNLIEKPALAHKNKVH